MRKMLHELEDQPWFPNVLRESMTDYLRYFLLKSQFYKPIIPVLKKAIERSGTNHIVDLCSGSGGPAQQMVKELQSQYGIDASITLTDKFPNTNAFAHLAKKSNGKINYVCESVDATSVPAELKGLRTIFSGFHHFDPETAKHVLKDAISQKATIAIFDGGDRDIFTIIAMIVFHPLALFFLTPFFRPFRWSRLLFTYVIPLIPICTVWDGVISILKLYSQKELLHLATTSNSPHYTWEIGLLKNHLGLRVAYLIGYPDKK
jgi:hypothetical protein